MSDFSDMMIEMLPLHSQLQKKDNPLRIVLDRTVGAYMDNFEIPYEQIFVTTATGGWLDAHGRDYGVPRRLDEDDESYRQRIIYEKLDHLTPSLLGDVYNVKLFTYREDFNVSDNTLVSDNPHIVQNESFLGVSDEDTISILDKKFILDSVVTWINSEGSIDYILDTRGINILSDYSKIYTLNDISGYFSNNKSIQKVKLNLPNVTSCVALFNDCTGLKNVKLNLPKLEVYSWMFGTLTFAKTTNLETIDVTIQTSIVTNFKSYVLGLNLTNLTSFKINGEEQL